MLARDPHDESGFWLAAAPATPVLRRVTLAAMAALFAIFVVAAAFANVPMAQSDGFIPFIQAAMFITELITAILLFTQYVALRSRAILVLANGYLFTALIVMAHTFAFPGALSPDGLLGAGLQTTGWLHIVWHFVFPVSVMAYALLKNGETTAGPGPHARPGAHIAWSVTAVFGAVVVLTAGLIAADAYVPRLILDRRAFAPLAAQAGLFDTLVCLLAFAVLWRRQSSFLDRWLLIAIFATVLEMAMVVIISGRFTLGWYAVRLFGFIASTVVLAALLLETMVLYARLATSIVLLRRERTHRLMSLDAATAAMAHEIRQPLAAISSSGAAGLNWLRRTPPDIEEARASLTAILQSSQRAADAISGVRQIFKKKADQRAMIQVGDVARQALSVMQQELVAGGVAVETDFGRDVPDIHADRVQLQQVITNLVRNATEAMDAISPRLRRLLLSTRFDGKSSVLLQVQDTGPGLKADDAAQAFDPFFTTKASGTGLGLSICQTIVEDHGGTLRLAKTSDQGSTFEIALPVAGARADGQPVP